MHNIHTSKNKEDKRPDSVKKEASDNINTMWTRLMSHNITQIPPKKERFQKNKSTIQGGRRNWAKLIKRFDINKEIKKCNWEDLIIQIEDN